MRRVRLTAAAAILDAGKTSLYMGGLVEREGKWGMTKMELEREGMTWKSQKKPYTYLPAAVRREHSPENESFAGKTPKTEVDEEE